MSETVIAAVAIRPGATELREFPLPEIPPDGGLMRIVATGICGSDWPMYNREKPGPRILGHEMVGTVAALGDAARERWGVKEGDLVALEEYLPRGHCDYCRTGEYRSCMSTDHQQPGAIRYGSTPIAVRPSLWGGYSHYLYLHPRLGGDHAAESLLARPLNDNDLAGAGASVKADPLETIADRQRHRRDMRRDAGRHFVENRAADEVKLDTD